MRHVCNFQAAVVEQESSSVKNQCLSTKSLLFGFNRTYQKSLFGQSLINCTWGRNCLPTPQPRLLWDNTHSQNVINMWSHFTDNLFWMSLSSHCQNKPPLIKLTLIRNMLVQRQVEREQLRAIRVVNATRATIFHRQYRVTRSIRQHSTCPHVVRCYSIRVFQSNRFLIKTIKWNLYSADWRHKSPDHSRYKLFLLTSFNRINLHVQHKGSSRKVGAMRDVDCKRTVSIVTFTCLWKRKRKKVEAFWLRIADIAYR